MKTPSIRNLLGLIAVLTIAMSARATAANLFVANTTDSGPGSLRQALSLLPANPGATIDFDITQDDPGFNVATGVYTIALKSPLPIIANSNITIDGTSELPSAQQPVIALDGSGLPQGSDGLQIDASNCTIEALGIYNFTGAGIAINGSSNAVGGCYIGGAAGANDIGIYVGSGTSNVIGGTTASAANVISSNTTYGVQLDTAGTSSNTIVGNLIGTDPTGTTAVPNTIGVGITNGAGKNTVGGSTHAQSNLISGQTEDGIDIVASNNNVVQGNFIGTDITFKAPLGNATGIVIEAGSVGNTIGGTTPGGDGNTISGNSGIGIDIAGIGTEANEVAGNLIGIDGFVQFAVPNGAAGVQIEDFASVNTIGDHSGQTHNIISGNTLYGIRITSSAFSNSVDADFIGTDGSGITAVPNGTGILIDGQSTSNTIQGDLTGSGSVISGNTQDGVAISDPNTSGNNVYGSAIGSGANGISSVPNGSNGVHLEGSSSFSSIGGTSGGQANTISGQNVGIYISDSGQNTIEDNNIGTDAGGVKPVPNGTGILIDHGSQANVIGNASAGNNISGNSGSGIHITGALTLNNQVFANNIGTGSAANQTGVLIDGASSGNTIGDPTAANVISGNTGSGIHISGSQTNNNDIFGNTIGNSAAGNQTGVLIDGSASNNVIGGAEEANTIEDNLGDGVLITGTAAPFSVGNDIENNTIDGNGGLGINLQPAGEANSAVTANDPGDVDAGPNDLQNFPLITSAVTTPNSTTIDGTLNSAPNLSYTIDIYKNSGPDPSGFGQGQSFVGATTASTDATGNGTFSLPFDDNLAGVYLTATATAQTSTNLTTAGDTSEFGPDKFVGPLVVTNTSDSGPGSLRQAILDANAAPGPDTITFDIPDVGPFVIAPSTPLPSITDTVAIDGYSQPGAAANTSLHSDGAVVEILIDASLIQQNPGTPVLDVAANDCILDGLAIENNIEGPGIHIGSAASGVTVTGCFLGTPDGLSAGFNGTDVLIDSAAAKNVIGDGTPGGANVIGSITIGGTGTSNNSVQGNYIATDATGAAALPSSSGLLIEGGASGNLIGGAGAALGNTISGAGGTGIVISDAGSSNNRIAGNIVGLDSTGMKPLASPSEGGIAIENGASNNIIDGTVTPNIVAGNAGDGIVIDGNGTTGNSVLANAIGVNAAGVAAGNAGNGVSITNGADNNTIGTAVDGNVISGNDNDGVFISDANTHANSVVNNKIGTNSLGSIAIPNFGNGVEISDGPTATSVSTNIISGNQLSGVVISGDNTAPSTISSGNSVSGNTIGLSGGNLALGNGGAGVLITLGANNNTVGGSAPGQGNVISGNGAGIDIAGDSKTETPTGNTVENNLIGTDATGASGFGNIGAGILIQGGALANSVGPGNTISANGGDGVDISDAGTSGNKVFGDAIGTNQIGTLAIGNETGVSIGNGAQDNVIGAVNGNPTVISGNAAYGVVISDTGTNGNTVQNCLIGTDLNGDAALPNAFGGVSIGIENSANTIGGVGDNTRNVISGNGGAGVTLIDSTGNTIQGNLIGLQADGASGLGNAAQGIALLSGANGNLIGAPGDLGGGAVPGSNIIANNPSGGITIDGTSNTDSILGNSIYANDTTNSGVGIGITPGGNNGQASPVLQSAVLNAGQLTVAGTLRSAPLHTFRLEFFANPSLDANNQGEGQTYLGATTVTTDATGNIVGGPFSFATSASTIGDSYITATATVELTSGPTDTSAFSNPIIIDSYGGNYVVNTNDSGGGSLRSAIGYANAHSPASIIFRIPAIDPGFNGSTFTIHSLSVLPAITGNGTIIDGNTQTNYSGAPGPLITINGSLMPLNNEASGLQVNADQCRISNLNINGFGDAGIVINGVAAHLLASNNLVQGCYLGTDVTGTIAVPNAIGIQLSGDGATAGTGAANNAIGGSTIGFANVISGNTQAGIAVLGSTTTGNVVMSNSIGIQAFGVSAMPNATGIVIGNGARGNRIGGANSGNIISGNSGDGIHITGAGTSANLVYGNAIGSVGAAGNLGNGINIDNAASGNVIGVTVANTIVDNRLNGVRVGSGINGDAEGNTIRDNTISGNGQLGINLQPAGEPGGTVTPPNFGAGPNGVQNYPVITAAVADGVNLTVALTLSGAPKTNYVIDLYGNGFPNKSGFGEGALPLGSANETTDATGNYTGKIAVTTEGSAPDFISATATSLATGNTSEFSKDATPTTFGLKLGIVPSTFSEKAGINAALGTVTRSEAAALPLVVKLTSSDITGATVPATVTILPNALSATFPIAAVDDHIPNDPKTITITAAAADGISGAASSIIHVTNADVPALTLTVTPAKFLENAGAEAATGTISRNGSLLGSVAVKLLSSNPNQAAVPATVTIPAGSPSTSFEIDAVDDHVAGDSQTVTIAATAVGYIPSSTPVFVTNTDVIAVTINQPLASISTGAQFQFIPVVTNTSDKLVTWRVAEANGGTVSASGLYTAPGVAGTYHVIATSRANPLATATATIVVVAKSKIANDDIGAALKLTGAAGAVNGSNVGATLEAGEPLIASKTGGASVWYSWKAPASGPAVFKTTGSSFNTLLAAYTLKSYVIAVSNLNAVAGNGETGDSPTSQVSFQALGGTTYYIAVDGLQGATGSIHLTWSLDTKSGNDDIGGASILTGAAGTVTGSNLDATLQPGEPLIAGKPGGSSIWYSWTAPAAGPAIFSTAGSTATAGGTLDTLLAVYTLKSDAVAVTNLNLPAVAANDDYGVSPTSQVLFQAVAGTTYYISVDGFQGATGSIHLTWSLSVLEGKPDYWILQGKNAKGINQGMSGSWLDARNWSAGHVPGAGDLAIIGLLSDNASLPGAYTVTLPASGGAAVADAIEIGAPSGASGDNPQLAIGTKQTLTLGSGGLIDTTGGLTLGGGTLTVNGALTVNGSLQWSGGTLGGSGFMSISSPKGNLTLLDDNSKSPTLKLLTLPLVNNSGTISWGGNGEFDLGSGSVIHNDATLTIGADAIAAWNVTNGKPKSQPQVVNDSTATITKTGGAGISGTASAEATKPATSFNNVALYNSGSLVVKKGVLRLGVGGGAGAFNVAQNAELQFTSNYLFDKTKSTFTGAGEYCLLSGSASFATGLDIPNLVIAGGTLGGSQVVNITSNLQWQAGTMSGTGSTTIDKAATLTLDGANTKTVDGRTIDNSGTIDWTGNGQLIGNDGADIVNSGTFNANVGKSSAVIENTQGDAPTFNNDGILNLTPTNGAGDTGTLSAHGDPFGGGTMTMNGSFFQSAAGILNVTVSGNTAGTDYDQLIISGAGHFGGVLNVTFANPGALKAGDTFHIVDYGNHTGTFTIRVVGLPSNLIAQPSYGLQGLVLTIVSLVPHTLTIGGNVNNGNGSGLGGATVQLAGPGSTSSQTVTDSSGNYKFQNLTSGTYKISASFGSAPITPAQAVSLTTANATGINFQATFSVGGHITDSSNVPLPGATVSLTNKSGILKSATSDANGIYIFTNLAAGTYGLSPTLKGWLFNFATVTVATPIDGTLQSFVGSKLSAHLAPGGTSGLSAAAASATAQTVTITFTRALNSASATDLANYNVILSSPAGAVVVAPESVAYVAASHTVVLSLPEDALIAGDSVVVQWNGLTDINGNALGGATGQLTVTH